ncbi:MAG: zinc-dependent metalloprotease [Bacteroidota bacterium]
MKNIYGFNIACIILTVLFFTPSSYTKGQNAFFSQKGASIQVDESALSAYLSNAQSVFTAKKYFDGLPISIPTPAGEQVFYFFKTQVLVEDLELENPQIQTYKGIAHNGIDQIRLELVSTGINVMLMDGDELLFLKPDETDLKWKKFKGNYSKMIDEMPKREIPTSRQKNEFNGFEGSVLKYRLAMSVSGEYNFFFGGNIDQTFESLLSTINRLNAILERDLGITLELVSESRQLIYSNPTTDPFNFPGNSHIGPNQRTIDEMIGNENYDIGHVVHFSATSEGMGIGDIGSVCQEGRKAQGYTIVNDPNDDLQMISLLGHNLGHQLGADDTFSRCDEVDGPMPIEPGSGSTIMSLGGLISCDTDNFVEYPSLYFHGASIEQIANVTRNLRECAELISNENTAPVILTDLLDLNVTAPIYTFPETTLIEFDAEVIDQEGDSLTYSWEQMDKTRALSLGIYSFNAATFRSIQPTDFSTRSLPSIEGHLASRIMDTDFFPFLVTDMEVRLTVRDNNPSGSAVSWKDFQLSFEQADGVFQITEPTMSVTWPAGSNQVIQWEVAGTDKSPFNTPLIDIFLVMDSMGREQIPLALEVPNNGFAVVTVPDNLAGRRGAIKVKGHGNIFYSMTRFFEEITGNVTSTASLAQEYDRIKIFPNPSDGRFKAEVEGDGRIVEVELLDMNGRVLRTEIGSDNYNFSDVKPGIYVIRMVIEDASNHGAIVNKRIIIN